MRAVIKWFITVFDLSLAHWVLLINFLSADLSIVQLSAQTFRQLFKFSPRTDCSRRCSQGESQVSGFRWPTPRAHLSFRLRHGFSETAVGLVENAALWLTGEGEVQTSVQERRSDRILPSPRPARARSSCFLRPQRRPPDTHMPQIILSVCVCVQVGAWAHECTAYLWYVHPVV